MSFRVDVLETANNHRTEKRCMSLCGGSGGGMGGIVFVFMVMTSGVMFKIKI